MARPHANELLYRSGAVELHPSGRLALDKVGQLASMVSQGNRIDVVRNTDDVPVGVSWPSAIPPTGSSPPPARRW